jgi:hypothetical protein
MLPGGSGATSSSTEFQNRIRARVDAGARGT